MTTKRKRIYEIALIACCCVIIALTAYMGITAVQKSMKLNLSFTVNPIVFCELKIENDIIFDNCTEPKVGGGVESVSGNVLTFNKDKFTGEIGLDSFNLTITNYEDTNSSILVEFGDAIINGFENFTDLISCESSETYVVTTTDLLQITMTQVAEVNLTLGSGVSINPSNNNILKSATGKNYLEFGQTFTAEIIVEEDIYENPTYTLNNGEMVALGNGNLISINYADLVDENNKVSLDISATFKDVIVTLDIDFTFSGDTTGIDSSFYFFVIVTDDPNFNISAAYNYRSNAVSEYYPIWTSSFDSTGYCYTMDLDDPYGAAGRTYSQAKVLEKLPDNYNEFTYLEASTTPAGTQAQRLSFNVKTRYKVFVYSSCLTGKGVGYLQINAAGSEQVKYEQVKLIGDDWCGVEFDMPANHVQMNIEGQYSYYNPFS